MSVVDYVEKVKNSELLECAKKNSPSITHAQKIDSLASQFATEVYEKITPVVELLNTDPEFALEVRKMLSNVIKGNKA